MRTHLATAACAALLAVGASTATALTPAAALTPTAPAAPATSASASASAAAQSAEHDRRGTLVSAERLYTLDGRADAAAELTAAGFASRAARYGVDAYRLVYRTVDAYGRPTTASGLLALPRVRQRALHPVSFTHGTGIHKEDAPSTRRGKFVSAATVSYATAGFAGIAPDYLGMGTGPGHHPWMDVPSETTATLDMLRAARAFAPRAGHTLRRDVLVTGFSQGASAALGLGRALQAGEDRWFRAGALAPVSGAYDFAGTELPALFDARRREARLRHGVRRVRARDDPAAARRRVRGPVRGVRVALLRPGRGAVRRRAHRPGDDGGAPRQPRRAADRAGPPAAQGAHGFVRPGGAGDGRRVRGLDPTGADAALHGDR
ncbi:hypothetical protein RB200_33930 [Streptomyces sp. PmtG]